MLSYGDVVADGDGGAAVDLDGGAAADGDRSPIVRWAPWSISMKRSSGRSQSSPRVSAGPCSARSLSAVLFGAEVVLVIAEWSFACCG
ncbi:hypothetical protein PL81_08060 [Streptomyces sp. RSD-27]|nr:hypothetical protein PL81_08060 [Streptomyces sp. RSD-27]